MAGILIVLLIEWDLQFMSMAKHAAEYMLKKDVIVNAKASAPDFWGVNGDFVSLHVESYLLTDFGTLYLFAPSPDLGHVILRMLLRLTGFQ